MPDNRFRIEQGSTSVNLLVFIRDSSVSYPKGKTGLLYNTASLVAYFIRQNSTSATAITLASGTLGAYTAGGFKEVSSTNMPGFYQFGVPNAVLISGVSQACIILKGAAGMADTPIEIELLPYNEETIYDRVDEAVLAAETVNRMEDALRRLSVALGSKRKG